MQLDDNLRHPLAGVAAAAAFLLLYFGLALVWWAALPAAAIVYLAMLLLVERKPPPERRMLTPDVSEADFQEATALLRAAAERFHRLAREAERMDRLTFEELASLLTRILEHHEKDPRDLRHTRRLIRHDLPRMVETAEAYVDLNRRAGASRNPEFAERLSVLRGRLDGYAPALARVEKACLENDFMALEVETEVLSEQLRDR